MRPLVAKVADDPVNNEKEQSDSKQFKSATTPIAPLPLQQYESGRMTMDSPQIQLMKRMAEGSYLDKKEPQHNVSPAKLSTEKKINIDGLKKTFLQGQQQQVITKPNETKEVKKPMKKQRKNSQETSGDTVSSAPKRRKRNPNWSEREVKYLLHCRFVDADIIDQFACAKTHQDTLAVWKLIAECLNIKGFTQTVRTYEQCQEKVKNLRREYNTITSSMLKTDGEEKDVKKPTYWETLEDCIGKNPVIGAEPSVNGNDFGIHDKHYTGSTSPSQVDRKTAIRDMCNSIESVATSFFEHIDSKFEKYENDVKELSIKMDNYQSQIQGLIEKLLSEKK